MAAATINSKWVSKTIEHARFWRKFYLESLRMSHNVALLLRNCITLLLFTIRSSYNHISRWPPKLSTQNGCQKPLNMHVLA